jgi:hypothetical protein
MFCNSSKEVISKFVLTGLPVDGQTMKTFGIPKGLKEQQSYREKVAEYNSVSQIWQKDTPCRNSGSKPYPIKGRI